MAESSPNGQKKLEKGEIACYEQFFPFPQCFQKTKVMQTSKIQGLFEKGITYTTEIKVL